jgi:LmbE family N-acetylglucosaminyl deacetylase
VIPFLLRKDQSAPLTVLVLGAHCDDIEIGCGGTLRQLFNDAPTTRVSWVVLSSDDVREREVRSAATRLLERPIEVDVRRFRNGYFPSELASIKDFFEQLKDGIRPDVIFTHTLADRHQDHRTVAELTWNTFRDHIVIEMEIPKYEGDLGRPNLYVPMSVEVLDHKIRTIVECYPSQSQKRWFSADTFRGLARIRGIECNAPSGFAEAFHCSKVVWSAT